MEPEDATRLRAEVIKLQRQVAIRDELITRFRTQRNYDDGKCTCELCRECDRLL